GWFRPPPAVGADPAPSRPRPPGPSPPTCLTLGCLCLDCLGMRADLVHGHLDLLVLSVVDAGASYGYAVLEAIRDRSGGAFDLPEGTVYPALYRLEADGLLASEWSQAGGRRRRVYRITRT